MVVNMRMKYIRQTINELKLNTILFNRKWQIALLAGVVLLLYLRTLSYEFIGLDEHSLLVTKKPFNEKLSSIPKTFLQHAFESEDYTEAPGTKKFYRPLLSVSFILDEQFSGTGYAFYHFTNILIHFFAACGMLFLLGSMNIPVLLSFFLALLFAAHPLLVQAVAWIPGRNDAMVAAFAVWSMYFMIRAGMSRKRNTLTVIHLLLFAAALFTKENALMLVPLFSFWIFFCTNNLSLSKKIMLLAFYLIISGTWYLAWKGATGGIVNSATSSKGLYYSFLDNFPLMLQYFQKTILPANLAVMASVKDINYTWILLAQTLFGAGIYFTKVIPWKEIAFGLAWFFLFLLPTLLFSYFEGMEHRSYLPAAGIFIALAFLDPVKNLQRTATGKWILLGTSIIFGAITFFRVPVFANELSYWKNAYETSEHSAVVCRDYGVILTKLGRFEEAEKAYLEGIRRNPKETLIHYNLGVMYYQMNRFEDAKKQLAEELNINPSNFMVYHVMGVLYKKQMRMEEASLMWEQAVSVNPKFAESYKELLSYYSQVKDTANFIRCKDELEKLGFKIVNK